MNELVAGVFLVGAVTIALYWAVILIRWAAERPFVKALFWLAAVIFALWAVVNHSAINSSDFENRWKPVSEAPLHFRTLSRYGFCYPQMCRIG